MRLLKFSIVPVSIFIITILSVPDYASSQEWSVTEYHYQYGDLDAPSFAGGGNAGGAPKESDSFYIDVNWSYPFQIDSHRFTIEGHMEYIGKRKNEFGNIVNDWFLAQPQFRFDVGNEFGYADHVFIGIEWQTWINKLGDAETDENRAQLLLVWRF
ncbi:MAG: hypothetical protein ACUZ8O_16950 [Candidatus Anammoxibacter sp.]